MRKSKKGVRLILLSFISRRNQLLKMNIISKKNKTQFILKTKNFFFSYSVCFVFKINWVLFFFLIIFIFSSWFLRDMKDNRINRTPFFDFLIGHVKMCMSVDFF